VAGRSARLATPERRCIATGTTTPVAHLIRLVVAPDGTLVPDVAQRLPGRGLWITPDRRVVERAAATGRFARAARRAVAIAPGLTDRIEALLLERCLGYLGLARRSSALVTGFEQVAAQLRAGRAALLVEARDGAPDGRRKLASLGRAVPRLELLTAAELSLALGRENVIHAALTSDRLAGHLMREAARLAGFRAALGDAGDGPLLLPKKLTGPE